MKGDGRSVLFERLGLFVVTFVLLALFVFAAQTVLLRAPFNATIVEDVYSLMNVTINNSDLTAASNISQVNITLPSGFTFLTGSNNANTTIPMYANLNHTFANTSSVLTWFNLSELVNASTTRTFLFNISAATPGMYNLTVTTLNITGSNSYNLAIVVNDTTAPSAISFVSSTLTDGSNYSQTSIPVSVSVTDNGVIDTIFVRLYNATGTQIRSNVSTTQGGATFSINYTDLPEGLYYINTSANDTYNNKINITGTRQFILDRTAPTISFSCDDVDVDKDDLITCSCSATDGVDAVPTVSLTTYPTTVETGDFTTTCSANDQAGNAAHTDIVYHVEGPVSSHISSGSGGGSSSSSTTITAPTAWTSTYLAPNTEVTATAGYTKSLSAKERVTITVTGNQHHVGISSLSATSATIEVASTPQSATLQIGETKKFEVTGDRIYDLQVTLVDITNNKANVTVKTISEAMPADAPAPETVTTTDTDTSSRSTTRTMMWIIAIIVLVLVVIYFVRRK